MATATVVNDDEAKPEAGSAHEARPSPREFALNVNKMDWEEAKDYPPGTRVKVLRHGTGREGWTILLDLPPGWHMDSHAHTTTEQHFVLEGSYEIDGRIFPAGSYQLISKGIQHGPLSSPTGAVILVMWDAIGT